MNIFLIKINIQQNKCFVSIELYLVHPKMYMFHRIILIFFIYFFILSFNNVIPSFVILYLNLRWIIFKPPLLLFHSLMSSIYNIFIAKQKVSVWKIPGFEPTIFRTGVHHLSPVVLFLTATWQTSVLCFNVAPLYLVFGYNVHASLIICLIILSYILILCIKCINFFVPSSTKFCLICNYFFISFSIYNYNISLVYFVCTLLTIYNSFCILNILCCT